MNENKSLLELFYFLLLQAMLIIAEMYHHSLWKRLISYSITA